MISMQVYKFIHFLGIFMVLMAYGAMVLNALVGDGRKMPMRAGVMISHGLGLFLVLLGGFGMLARMGIVSAFPGWILAKLAIWLVLGGLVAVVNRVPLAAKPLWYGVLVLAGLAAYLGGFKPF
jgi:hypothetical protein